MKLKRMTLLRLLICVAAVGLLTQQALGGISFAAEGISGKGVDIRFEADLSISGDILTIVLTNNSPVDSLNPDDLLCSFYFDIINADGLRPALTYDSAAGDVYLASKTLPDSLQQANADIMAESTGDNSWMFATMDEMLNPYMGFGIGTVGNSNLSPNNFNGNIVDGVDYAIFKGEITTQNLDGKLLVKESATFTFSGAAGFKEGDIVDTFAFGLGTAPDSLLTPEPTMAVLVGLGGLLLRRKR